MATSTRTRKNTFLWLLLGLVLGVSLVTVGSAETPDPSQQRFVRFPALDKYERTKIINAGVSIEHVLSDSVWGYADSAAIEELHKNGVKVLDELDASVEGFPREDEKFHDYSELQAALQKLETENPELVKIHVLGHSLEGRDLLAIQINSNEKHRVAGLSTKPGIVFMGTHHAREHVSTEIPLMLAQHLMTNKNDSEISRLLESRDIWIVPMLNPDGVEWDIASNKAMNDSPFPFPIPGLPGSPGDDPEAKGYKSWRKNRRKNHDGTWGVDLNRNYGYKWGGQGSSSRPSSDTYRGPEKFSEPETQAVKKFVEERKENLSILLSFHTFSELILYPWGHTYDSIERVDPEKRADYQAYVAMAETMANWNGYKPQQSSDLYITSGDTTDWSYGEHGIFSFTFELSPKSWWEGGFYPGQKAIQPTFDANIKPCLYLIDLADNPRRAAQKGATEDIYLKHYVQPGIDPAWNWSTHPMGF